MKDLEYIKSTIDIIKSLYLSKHELANFKYDIILAMGKKDENDRLVVEYDHRHGEPIKYDINLDNFDTKVYINGKLNFEDHFHSIDDVFDFIERATKVYEKSRYFMKFKEFINENKELKEYDSISNLLKIRLKNKEEKYPIRGSHLVGEIFGVSYESLVNLLGDPNSDGDAYKIDVEWELFINGEFLTIYNWKDGKNYCGDEGLDIENIKDWHIGSNKDRTDEILILQGVLDSMNSNTVECFLSTSEDKEILEDQFLRLKEVYNCEINIIPISFDGFKYFISAKNLKGDPKNEFYDKEKEEISRIQQYLGKDLIPIK